MRGLDTNVLVRYLVADDPRQSAAAVRLVEECRRTGERMFLSTPVLCEMVWVLRSVYAQPKPEIVRILESLMRTPLFHLDRWDLVEEALEDFRDGKGDLSDYLIAAFARDAGCRDVATFDRALKGAEGFTFLG